MPGDNEDAVQYKIRTIAERLVAEYTNLSFSDIEEINIDIYLLLLRDAFIYRKRQTEEGREYLENCWILEQTEPDRKTLRENFKKGE